MAEAFGGVYKCIKNPKHGTTGATFDSSYSDVVVTSVPVVNSADPGGSAPTESPFKDAIAKEK